MPTVELMATVTGDLQELFVAELAELGFDSFVVSGDAVRAYVAAGRYVPAHREHVARWLANRGGQARVEVSVIDDRNWNAEWEAGIQPIAVGPFLIKPTWADLSAEDADLILLEVDPKMSFGTGYHASTRLVLRQLPHVVEGGDRVLDAGTGTGLLAIAAIKLGAEHVFAFDVSPWTEENAAENVQRNGVGQSVRITTGGIEVVDETDFDVVLANINRNILLDMLPAFRDRTVPGGRVVLSGLLVTDRAPMLRAAYENNFSVVDETVEEEWLCLTLKC